MSAGDPCGRCGSVGGGRLHHCSAAAAPWRGWAGGVDLDADEHEWAPGRAAAPPRCDDETARTLAYWCGLGLREVAGALAAADRQRDGVGLAGLAAAQHAPEGVPARPPLRLHVVSGGA